MGKGLTAGMDPFQKGKSIWEDDFEIAFSQNSFLGKKKKKKKN